ncbi:hypothetical protein PN36_15675 [Candidatus Thiomargarita nelsonii]|uniref:Uncharacterized protein n=1 Tax=Candidatus Thiomargarita nelsonii TaxID=1003181 RepID=A0A4E0QNT2_9GAMM|nr:hypothetical protein PN36_15675 [Candidatus Thiomargarita nelsonii]
MSPLFIFILEENKEAYLQYLRSQGINIGRLEESIKQLEAGEVETVKLDALDYLLGAKKCEN